MIRQERVHPLVYSLPHSYAKKCSNLWARTCWKGNTGIRLLKGKRAGAAIYWGENKLPFWVAQRRAECQGKTVLSVEWREPVLGLKCSLLSQQCGPYNSHLCSSYLLLRRKLKCQPVGCSCTIWFGLLLPLPRFVLVCTHFMAGQMIDQTALPGHDKNNAEIIANWEVVVLGRNK